MLFNKAYEFKDFLKRKNHFVYNVYEPTPGRLINI